MRTSVKTGALIVSGLTLLILLSARSSFGQEHDNQVSRDPQAPPLGLGLGHSSNEEIRQRIVDRSRGHVPVDPNTLRPPAFSPDSTGTFEWHAPKPYTCWVVEPGEERHYAPGTAVACYVTVTLADDFVYGDGSLLIDKATGKPDDFFGFSCDGFDVKDFSRNRWRAVRYFDSQLNQIGTIRAQRYEGINYNYTTGKSVAFNARYIEIDTMQPVDGTADNEFSKFLGDDYGPIVGPHGRVLADSAGRIDYTPGLASILYVAGPHPLDAFYAGDPSGILPICNALK
jgi:hypothetical protein